MAWVAPRTWVDNETATAAMLNEQIRDNMFWLWKRPMVRVRLADTDIALPTGTWTTVNWSTGVAEYDPGNVWDSGTPTRFTAGTAGKWMIAAQTQFSGDTVSYRGARLRFNGSGSQIVLLSTRKPAGTRKTVLPPAVVVPLSASDYWELQVIQNSGVNTVEIEGNESNSETALSAHWLGA